MSMKNNNKPAPFQVSSSKPSERARTIETYLSAWRSGDKTAINPIMDQLYGDIFNMARSLMAGERANHTWQPEGLVNELFLGLLRKKRIPWLTCENFLGSVLIQMRHLLIDYARARKARPQSKASPYKEALLKRKTKGVPETTDAYLTLSQALREFGRLDPEASSIATLRMVGYTFEEIARHLHMEVTKVIREWRLIKSFICHRLESARNRTVH